jgi:hypothetical protein
MYAPARPDLPPLSMPSKNASGDLGQERISVAQFFFKKSGVDGGGDGHSDTENARSSKILVLLGQRDLAGPSVSCAVPQVGGMGSGREASQGSNRRVVLAARATKKQAL